MKLLKGQRIEDYIPELKKENDTLLIGVVDLEEYDNIKIGKTLIFTPNETQPLKAKVKYIKLLIITEPLE